MLQLQNTADAAALASVTLVSPDNEDDAGARAIVYAEQNMAPATHGNTLVDGDITLGGCANNAFDPTGAPQNAVRVTTRRAQANGNAAQSFFLSLFGVDSVDIVAEAIATTEAFQDCLIVLNPNASGALDLDSNASITANSCAVKVNSSSNNAIKTDSNSSITVGRICMVGGFAQSGTSTITPAPTTGCAKTLDPLAGLAPPAIPGSRKKNQLLLERFRHRDTQSGQILRRNPPGC